jgi:hypothetical protein
MRTLLVLLLLSVGSSFAQTIRHFECLGPMVGGSNESSRVAATMAGGPYNGTVHAVIIYCVDPGANDLLPTYFLQLPALYEDFYRRSSSGQLDLVIDAVLSRDPDHAFVATVGHGTSGFVCSDQFMRDVFSQVDATYDLGQFDNDGPDGLANSGDDDGNVDMVFFWLLNASTRGVFPLYDLLQSYVTADTSWGPNHTYRGRIEISPANGFENRKDLHDVAVGMVDWLGPTLHESGHALGRFPDMEHSG